MSSSKLRVYNNELYVFGGGDSETYSDEYKVNF